LKGLVGRKRRVAARAGFIFLSMRVNTRRLVPRAEMSSDICPEPLRLDPHQPRFIPVRDG
jgi:hypothetical protein